MWSYKADLAVACCGSVIIFSRAIEWYAFGNRVMRMNKLRCPP
jgi:hypothetical protein